MVWSNTTTVGCGRKACDGEDTTPGYYVVCEYYPPGNVEGDNNQYFVYNVKEAGEGETDGYGGEWSKSDEWGNWKGGLEGGTWCVGTCGGGGDGDCVVAFGRGGGNNTLSNSSH